MALSLTSRQSQCTECSCHIRAKRLVIDARPCFPLRSPMKCRQSEMALVEGGASNVRYGSNPVPSPTTSCRASSNSPLKPSRCSLAARSFSSKRYRLLWDPRWRLSFTDFSTVSFSSMLALVVSLECHQLCFHLVSIIWWLTQIRLEWPWPV